MKIIFNFTAAPITPAMFKAGVVEAPTFLKEGVKEIDSSVTEGKNTCENGIRLVMGLLKDAAPSGAAVAILLPDSTPYREWKLVTNIGAKLGVDVIIDTEL